MCRSHEWKKGQAGRHTTTVISLTPFTPGRLAQRKRDMTQEGMIRATRRLATSGFAFHLLSSQSWIGRWQALLRSARRQLQVGWRLKTDLLSCFAREAITTRKKGAQFLQTVKTVPTTSRYYVMCPSGQERFRKTVTVQLTFKQREHASSRSTYP